MADYTDDENASTGQSSSLSEVSGSAKSLVGKQNAKLKAKAKEAGQKLKKDIGKSIKEGFKALLRTPHGWIVILIICLLIIFLAIVAYIQGVLSNQKTNTSAAKYVAAGGSSKKKISATKDSDGNEIYSADDKKKLYNDSRTLMTFSTDEIKDMAETMISGESDSQVSKDYSSKLKDDTKKRSGVQVNNTSDIVLPSQERSFLEHMLLSEKYNFNNVKWVKYDHSNNGVDLTESEMQTNKELGLLYPANSQIKSIISMILPYLQSWKIPLAMYSGEISGNNAISSASGKNVQLAWQILLEAYSDITVNQYEMQTLTRNYTREDTTEIVCTNEVKKTSSSDYKPHPDAGNHGMPSDIKVEDKGSYTESYQVVGEEVCVDTSIKETKGAEKQNGSDQIETKYEYRIAEALTFDLMVKNSYVYKKYNTNENPNSESEYESGKTGPNLYLNDTKIDLNNSDNLKTLYENGTFKSKELSQQTDKTFDNGSGYTKTDNQTNTVKYTKRTTKTFSITRKWSDSLTNKEVKSTPYTYNDLLTFVKAKKDAGYETEGYEEKDGKGSINKSSVYKDLAESEKLNRIDFINAVSGIYNKYVKTPAYDGLAITRGNLYYSYYNLEESLKEIEKDGKYPYVYGISLGLKNVATAKKYTGDSQDIIIPEDGYMWPVRNKVVWQLFSDEYIGSYGGTHHGVDILAYSPEESTSQDDKDAPIYPIEDGKVVEVVSNITTLGYIGSNEGSGWGNHILIDHGNGIMSRYAHIAPGGVLVNVGDEVKKGEQIAWMGSTGSSSAKHVHLEILVNGTRVDPLLYYGDSIVRVNDESIKYKDDYDNGTRLDSYAGQYKYVAPSGNKVDDVPSVDPDETPDDDGEESVGYSVSSGREFNSTDISSCTKNGKVTSSIKFKAGTEGKDCSTSAEEDDQLYALEEYKNNNAQLMARHVTEELGITETDISKVSKVYVYAVTTQMIQSYFAAYTLNYATAGEQYPKDVIYTVYKNTGFMSSMQSSQYKAFNKAPPKWVVQIAQNFIDYMENKRKGKKVSYRYYPPYAPGWEEDGAGKSLEEMIKVWNGIETISIWDGVERFNGMPDAEGDVITTQTVGYHFYNGYGASVWAVYGKKEYGTFQSTQKKVLVMAHPEKGCYWDIEGKTYHYWHKTIMNNLKSNPDFQKLVISYDDFTAKGERGNTYVVGKAKVSYKLANGNEDSIYTPVKFYDVVEKYKVGNSIDNYIKKYFGIKASYDSSTGVQSYNYTDDSGYSKQN